MDVSDILDKLNEVQRDAVSSACSRALVLAGAGSGKTRVLVHRIAWLIRVEGVSPYEILGVTFTNKAASEMRNRVGNMLGHDNAAVWLGTFHGIAHRLLRMHWQEAGLPQTFQVLDAEDQLRLVRRIQKNLRLDESRWPPRQALWFINGQKDEGIRAASMVTGDDPFLRTMAGIYHEYEQACERAGLVDFAELLLRAHEMLRDDPRLLSHYRTRFRHVLVDEFQDTNTIQYAWLRLLVDDSMGLFVVGDDDQSIYGWRGAKIENILKVSRDFEPVSVFRLEQNYRSTGTILKAANALISNNSERMGKNLWTDGDEGEPIRYYTAFNDYDEAHFVVDRIRSLIDQGFSRNDLAILYRSNVQSRLFEEGFMRAGIPYRVYGGLRFFERAEIKDALAYLRMVANRQDDASFERVVNTPTRGIGDKTVETVRQLGREQQLCLWDASALAIRDGKLSGRAASALTRFIDLIDQLADLTAEMELGEKAEKVVEVSGLISLFSKDKTEKGRNRIENLGELVNAARGFEAELRAEGEIAADTSAAEMLNLFLSHAALESGEGQAREGEACVQMMTLHSAKGLEFPVVFMVGLEQGLFPSRISVEEDRLEEERRLCYVGITRAQQQLYITNAEKRRLYGQEKYCRPSQFLTEVPDYLIQSVRSGRQSFASTDVSLGGSRMSQIEMNKTSAFRLGQAVMHHKFGEGVVVSLEGGGANARIQVAFSDAGTKWLMLNYANLQPA